MAITRQYVDRALRRRGYDGLVYANFLEGRGEDSYAVFRPSQIKMKLAKTLFAKRAPASEARDEYGRWTVGQGNANAAKAYAHFKVAERGTVKNMAAEARTVAGKRGETLRRKVFEANGREFLQRGLDKVKSQQKRLSALLDIHATNMGLISHEASEKEPSEQARVRAAIFAHALQHNEGPMGKLTPAYRDYIQRKVKAAIAAEGTKMKTAMTARKPRAATRAPNGAAKVLKFNQDHEANGQFGGPGGSHDPTGNPRGRPPGPAQPSTGQAVGEAAAKVGGWAVGGWLGAAALGAAGTAIGGPVGTAIGSVAGKYVGSILGGLAGDYVATKVGQSLLGIKQQADGHAVGTGETVGMFAADALPLAARFIPGGNAVAAGARALFSPANQSLTSHLVEEGIGSVGTLAGRAVDQRAGAAGGSKIASAASKIGGKSRPAVAKSLFDAPPKKYDGSFGSMTSAALPHLFGPRAWKEIANTPFGSYVRQKVKDTADKMDDAAEAHGIDLKPAPKGQVDAVQRLSAQQQMQEHTAQQQAAMQPPPVPGGAPGAPPQPGAPQQQPPPGLPPKSQGPKKPGLFAKALSLPLRGPNDGLWRDAQRTDGAPASVRFLRMMQDVDRKNRIAQLNVALGAGPKVENLARKPSEDEKTYQLRVQQVMQQSVRESDKLRPHLFNGGAARTVYKVRKTRSEATSNDNDPNFTIEAEIIKELGGIPLDKGLVYGWASIIEKNGEVVTDHQGDRISADELEKAAHDFVKNSRQGGVLHDEYGHKIGHIVESVVFSKELQKALGIDLGKVGWMIGYQIEDPRVKTLVKSGLLKSFSIGGRGKREPVQDAA